MKNYIVRIYRRPAPGGEGLVGIVENPAAGNRKAFTCLDDLRKIITSSPAVRKKPASERSGRTRKKRMQGRRS